MSSRNGAFSGMETPFSRWVARLVAKHLILGTVFESVIGSASLALLAYILSGQIRQAVVTWIVLFVVFVGSFGLYNLWRLFKRS
jgi:hypothetical protein